MSFENGNNNVSHMNKRTFRILMILIIIVIIIIGISFFSKYNEIHINNIDNDVGNNLLQKESDDLLSRLSKVYLIKNDEKPAIISITDSSYFENQPFFSLAQKDDKVFIFSKEKRAILFRPSIDKIIEVVPVTNNSGDNINSIVISDVDKNVTTPKSN